MTRERCATLCGRFAAAYSAGKPLYAALEAADQCRCGAVDPSLAGGTKVADNKCNMTCKADPDHTCGGDWRADVYTLSCEPAAAAIAM